MSEDRPDATSEAQSGDRWAAPWRAFGLRSLGARHLLTRSHLGTAREYGLVMLVEFPRSDADQLADAWAAARRLRRDETYYGQATLGGLLAKRDEPWRNPSRDETVLLDHSRYFKAPGKRLAGVAVSAPYIASLNHAFQTLASAQLAIQELAGELGLRVRMGLPQDIIWPGTPLSPMGTYPIVWWNPERCDLPVLESEAYASEPASVFGTAWDLPMFHLPNHPLVREDFSDQQLQEWAQRFGRAV